MCFIIKEIDKPLLSVHSQEHTRTLTHTRVTIQVQWTGLPQHCMPDVLVVLQCRQPPVQTGLLPCPPLSS